MNVSPAIATSGKFSSRLLNSIAVFSVVWPAECAATALVFVHFGQSGQPRPEDDKRTAAPVEMITALAITDASAQPRSDSRRRLPYEGDKSGKHAPHANAPFAARGHVPPGSASRAVPRARRTMASTRPNVGSPGPMPPSSSRAKVYRALVRAARFDPIRPTQIRYMSSGQRG